MATACIAQSTLRVHENSKPRLAGMKFYVFDSFQGLRCPLPQSPSSSASLPSFRR